MALRHIKEVIQPSEKCLILTDSLNLIKAMLSRRISWRTHPHYMDSVPCEVGGWCWWMEKHRPLSPCDFQSLARPFMLREWQRKWDFADTGQFAHSILPRVSLRSWFEGQKKEKSFVTSVSRIMSERNSVRSQLDRFRIVEDSMCVCLKVRGLGQRDTDLLMHCPNWMCYMGLLFGICVVYESGVP
jgi:hypothetical protein